MEVLTELVDGHAHLVFGGELDQPAFEQLCTEADTPAPPGTSHADSQLGVAVRRWCPPALGLPAHLPLADYLRRRAQLGPGEANRLLLRAAGLTEVLVDTGIAGGGFLGLADLAQAASATVREVVRLETVAERLAASGVAAPEFAGGVRAALRGAPSCAAVVAGKAVLAYPHGIHRDPTRAPDRAGGAAAVGVVGGAAGAGAQAPRLPPAAAPAAGQDRVRERHRRSRSRLTVRGSRAGPWTSGPRACTPPTARQESRPRPATTT